MAAPENTNLFRTLKWLKTHKLKNPEKKNSHPLAKNPRISHTELKAQMTQQQKTEIDIKFHALSLLISPKRDKDQKERGLRALLMTKISTTTIYQPEHIEEPLLDTQQERKREPNREAL